MTRRARPTDRRLSDCLGRVTAWMMQPGDDKVVAERIYGVLSAKRGPRSTAMPAPSANVSGRWDVEIEFFSSRSKHTLFIEQDGNWIQASHQGDFTVRDMVGMIEGNEVKLRSIERRPGASVTFIFSGTSGDTMSGPIHDCRCVTSSPASIRLKPIRKPYAARNC